jgi:hypothetical protein
MEYNNQIAFFCSTPYQILISLQIKLSFYKNVSTVLYVLNHFNESAEYVTRIEKTNIFDKVIHVECFEFTESFNTNSLCRYHRKLKSLYSFEKLSDKYLNIKQEKYTDIYLSFPDIIIQIGIKKVHKNNKNVKIHLYEDGTAGYTNALRQNKKIKILYNKITGSGRIIDRYDELLVFKPELMPPTNITLTKIPPLNVDDIIMKNILNKVFGYYDEKIDERIVFLEQPYSLEALYKEIANIAKIILKDNYIIKLHPRSKSYYYDNYDNYNLYDNNSIPWEIICLNSNIENKILISFYSTATITNKIIFDKEPILIFLFDIPELKRIYSLNAETRNFIQKFKKTYNNSDRIIIPKSIDELKGIFEDINNK